MLGSTVTSCVVATTSQIAESVSISSRGLQLNTRLGGAVFENQPQTMSLGRNNEIKPRELFKSETFGNDNFARHAMAKHHLLVEDMGEQQARSFGAIC